MSALVIAEYESGQLKPATAIAVTAAKVCSDDVHILVIGSDIAPIAKEAAALTGVTKVLAIEDMNFKDGLAEHIAAEVAGIAGTYEHILAGATSFAKNLLPRVAALLDVTQVSEITKVVSADTFERPIYAGNAIATVQVLDPIKVLSVRTTSFVATETGNDAAVEYRLSAAQLGAVATLVGRETVKSERPELTAAKVVVSGGRGMGSAEDFHLLEPLADKLNAAIGASRAAVDAGFAANDLQVGQTGKIVAPQLYVAVGISGAIQHLAGMKDSKVIVAINKDAEAPIFSVADYGIVGDLFEIVPAIAKALQ
ncbi:MULTISPECIES: FAD-binding protein [unclassified Herbaspirillum]|uniref:electron transfer flavoprotein subunit alpha/FixB family protein n=1 Tax=unclassified Herbaspirillum TaxID=2624150 RepID=UPI000E2E9276|nr:MULTISPECIES: FAD-binding protein [unclassified Herbaspirillum]RFB71177.1 electron transfer flavoprotein subunit alpha/FixB family protein [Herbaspirillum sp. 3R-3a1]TFI08287.1 electron transfer flavoprotein subunit alpha/FixB family protein [Herbaspirillum sp. 3R11]TFI14702.1 electron transfer flavoprotein subunit alpha/FixB family protein [Herbaspirillum sp. 3R-11]TFI31906.1 electron transfer flavoprotein subunit alpha/FixB family protein [Herbaspirillum sp. 3C11]TFI32011.1 electron trans